MHERQKFSTTERVIHSLKNFGRFVMMEHPIPLGGPVSNIVPVAGRDPFAANSDLPPEELFTQAREYENERIELGRQLGIPESDI